MGEELGLTRALNMLESKDQTAASDLPLSEELFQCTVCTSYNRCVVSMFTYTCDTNLESISWQEEEVNWGDYMPYDVVQCAGDLSIDRLVKKGVWPGSNVNTDNTMSNQQCNDEVKRKYGSDTACQTWDFVPDGLLVWEAWKAFVKEQI